MRRLFMVLALAAAAPACGGMDACPNDLPASCPADAPSYTNDVAPIISERCLVCHGPGGQASNKPLDSYDNVYARRSAVLNQLYACNMPPAGNPAPTEDERLTILNWLVCGAPNN